MDLPGVLNLYLGKYKLLQWHCHNGLLCFRKRLVAVLQEMLGLPQTPPSLVSLLTEKLLGLISDDHRRIQMVGFSHTRAHV